MVFGKVKKFVERENLLHRDEKVVVAVSGGPDSLCLLHILRKLSAVLSLKLVVAHLNHGLRQEAELEEENVRTIAAGWGFTFESRRVDIRAVKRKSRLSEEEAGRLERYRFLLEMANKHGAQKIALGHQLDDQAETVLLNIFRGTGVDGLAGILPLKKLGGVWLIRPLLPVTRAEVEAYCRQEGLKPSTDSSNLEPCYTRNKLRLQLIPLLEEEYNPRVKEALAGLATLAARDRSYLQDKAKNLFCSIARPVCSGLVLQRSAMLKMPPALRGRVLMTALGKMIPPKRLGRSLLETVNYLVVRPKDTGQFSLPCRVNLAVEKNTVFLKKNREIRQGGEPLREKKLKVPGITFLPGEKAILATTRKLPSLKWPPPSEMAYLDFEALEKAGPLFIRYRWPGARFFPQGAPGSKKLKDFFIDRKVPAHERDRWPLVTAGGSVAWVTGIRIAEQFRVTPETGTVLVLKIATLKSGPARKAAPPPGKAKREKGEKIL